MDGEVDYKRMEMEKAQERESEQELVTFQKARVVEKCSALMEML